MCWGQGGALYERQVLFPKEPRRTRAGRQLKGWTVVGRVCSSFQKQLRAVLEGLPPHTLLSHGHLQRHHRLRTEDEVWGRCGGGAGQQVAAGVGPSEGRAGRCSRRLTCEAADQDRGVRVASGFRLEEPGRWQ